MWGGGVDLARASAGFAINRHHVLLAQRWQHAANQRWNADSNSVGSISPNNRPKVSRDGMPCSSFEASGETTQAFRSPGFDFDEGVSAGQHAIDRHHKHF